MWIGETPDLTNIKASHCRTYMKRLEQVKKLENRCKAMILIRYATRGYKLFDVQKGKVTVSRDVIVLEHQNAQ